VLRLLKTSVYFSTEHNACKKQVSVITKACYFQTRNIGHTRSYIYMTKESRKTLVCWLYMYVTSGLWKHLLYGVNTYIISKLQRVQNTEARLINRSKKYDHIDHTSSRVTLLVYGAVLHPIQLFIYSFKAFHDQPPISFEEPGQLSPMQPPRSLRSENARWLFN
jgi:hypothetical protein